jgi:hypothetical protein
VSSAGHVCRAMLSRYSHLRMEPKRRSLNGIARRQREADEKRQKAAEQKQQAAGGLPCSVGSAIIRRFRLDESTTISRSKRSKTWDLS